MAVIVPTSAEVNLELAEATMPQYWKDAADLTKRGRIQFTLLEELGLMEFNVDTSFAMIWRVINKLPDVTPQGGSTSVVFDENTSLTSLEVDLRGYRATDRWDHKNWLTNRGKSTQIVNIYDHKSKMLLKAMRKMVNADFYIDGYASGNSNRYIGLNSFMGAGTVTSADRVAMPDDSYAGKSTVLGAYGGAYSDDLDAADQYNAALNSDWPDGVGSEEFDFLSPLLVNYLSSAWETGSRWILNCEEVLRFAMDVQQNRGATLEDTNAPPLALMGRRMFTEFKEYFSNRNQQQVQIPEAVDLGFPEVLNFEGTWCAFDYDCPSREVYLMHPGAIEYFSPQDDMFDVFGPEWSLTDMAFLYLVSNYANFRFQPKLFAKLAPYAAA